MTLQKVCKVIIACAVPHNICISLNESDEDEKDNKEEAALLRPARWKGDKKLCEQAFFSRG